MTFDGHIIACINTCIAIIRPITRNISWLRRLILCLFMEWQLYTPFKTIKVAKKMKNAFINNDSQPNEILPISISQSISCHTVVEKHKCAVAIATPGITLSKVLRLPNNPS